jgi:hypothetical protein
MTLDELIMTIKSSSQHNCLYHFSDISNFETIDKFGILSKYKMELERFTPKTPGGNELSWGLDRKKGIYSYVSLCMTKNHPMKYIAEKDGRLKNSRYLGISADVLKLPNTLIAFGIANANDVDLFEIENATDMIDIEVIYKKTDWKNPEILQRLKCAEKVEILIKDFVPKNLILRPF